MSKTTKTPILNGILQGNLDANGFAIINATGAGNGSVTTVTGDNGSNVGLTLTVTNPTTTPALALGATLNWAALNKSGSSLADLATRAYSDLTGKPATGLVAASNLSDVADAPTSRTNLGLGTASTHAATDFLLAANNLSDVVAATAKSNLALSTVATTGAYSDLSGKPTLATVATSGSYTDLTSKPTIPATSAMKKGNGTGGLADATATTDYWDTTAFAGAAAKGLVPSPGANAGNTAYFLNANGAWSTNGAGGVSGVSMVNANGFYGSVANPNSTPAITLFLADSGDATKKAHFVLSGLTTGNDRAITVPDAASTLVVADTGASNNFLTAISAAGAISKAQPAFTNLSGSVAASQMPALTGDVTTAAGAVASTIANGVVTYAKIQNVSAASKVLLRKTAGAGSIEEGSLSDLLDFIGSAARGDILYRGASSWMRLPAGASGDFLQTNGAGADPAWAALLTSVLTTTNLAETQQTLSGTNVTWDMNSGGDAKLTLTGATTMNAPSNTRTGAIYCLEVVQGAGPYAITWNSVFVWPGGTTPTLTATSGHRDIFTFRCSNSKLYGTSSLNYV